MGLNPQSKEPRLAGVPNMGTLVIIRILSLVSEGSCLCKIITSLWSDIYVSEPRVRGYRKHLLSLWLNKGIFWVSEQGIASIFG